MRFRHTDRVTSVASRVLICCLVAGSSAACTRTADGSALGDDEAEGASDVEDESTSGSEGTSESESGETGQACTAEWDCGVGERCVDGLCTCMGCACASGRPAPSPVWEPAEPSPVFFDIPVLDIPAGPPDCVLDSDCDPIGYCSDGQCIESTACTEHEECRTAHDDDRFCVEGICQPINCDYAEDGDLACPKGSLCIARCRWLELLPTCPTAPQFEVVQAHAPADPAATSFVVLDLDADGRDDIAVLDAGVLSRVMSSGGGFEHVAWPSEPGAELVAITRADIHGDGIDELLIAHADPAGVEIIGTAQGPQTLGFVPTQQVPEQLALLDVDYDALPDLVIAQVLDQLNQLEIQLGDGTGVFMPHLQAEEDSFVFGVPYAAYDRPSECERTLSSLEAEYVGGRRFDSHGLIGGTLVLIDRGVTDFMIYAKTGAHSQGHVATAPLDDRGVLFHHNRDVVVYQHIEVPAEPSAVAFARLGHDDAIVYALVDHQLSPASVIEFITPSMSASCRTELDMPLAAGALEVGDFDGDGREDILALGYDGVLRVWFSRS